MYQVRFHGRGGQGVVTAAELLASAAIADGRYALAFPSFGSERTGAPVEAYCRIADEPIRSREPVADPDAVVVLDATLLRQGFVFDGLKPGGIALINSVRTSAEQIAVVQSGAARTGVVQGDTALASAAQRDAAAALALCSVRVLTVPATEIARGRTGRPLPNVPMLGALAAATKAVTLDAVRDAVGARFPGPLAEANALAVADAFDHVLVPHGGFGPDPSAAPEAPSVRS